MTIQGSEIDSAAVQALLTLVRNGLNLSVAGLLTWEPQTRPGEGQLVGQLLAWQGDGSGAEAALALIRQRGVSAEPCWETDLSREPASPTPAYTAAPGEPARFRAWVTVPLPQRAGLWLIAADERPRPAYTLAEQQTAGQLLALAASALGPAVPTQAPTQVPIQAEVGAAQAAHHRYLQEELETARAVLGISALTELQLTPPVLMLEAMRLVGVTADVDWSGFLAVQDNVASTISAWHAAPAESFAGDIQREFGRTEHPWLWSAITPQGPLYLDQLPPQAPDHPLGRDVRALSVVSLGEYDGVRYVLATLRLHRVAPWSARDQQLLQAVSQVLAAALERQEQRRQLELQRQELRFTLDHAPLIRWRIDRQGTFQQSDGQALSGLELATGQLVGQSVYEVYRDQPELLTHVRKALGGQTFTATVSVQGRTFENRYVPLRSRRGEVTGVLGLAYDVTERVVAEQHAQVLVQLSALLDEAVSLDLAAEQGLALLQEVLAVDSLVLWRRSGPALRPLAVQGVVPPEVQPLLADGLPGDHPAVRWALAGDPLRPLTGRGVGRELRAGPGPSAAGTQVLLPVWLSEPGETVLLGVYCSVSQHCTPVQEELLEAAIRTLRAAVGRDYRLRQLETQAMTDPLTGLGNRRAFEAAAEAEVARSLRHGSVFSVLSLDVDGFKVVNDTQGHAAGDQLLVALAGVLSADLRAEDQLFRLGGDELVALLPHAGPEHADCLHRRVMAAAETIRAAGYPQVGLSAGLASSPADARCLPTLLALSDQRLYADKLRKLNPGTPTDR